MSIIPARQFPYNSEEKANTPLPERLNFDKVFSRTHISVLSPAKSDPKPFALPLFLVHFKINPVAR